MSSLDFVQHGRALVEQGQYQEAVKVCRLGLLAHPTALDGRLVLGSALISLERYDEVLAEMRVALEIDEANAWALALRGEALLYKGDTFGAAQVLEQALARAPDEQYIRDLCRRAQNARVEGGPGAFSASDTLDSLTKNYPAHGSFDEEFTETTDDGNVTYPDSAIGDHLPIQAAAGQGGRSATIELDPSLDSLEMVEDLELETGPPMRAPDAGELPTTNMEALAPAYSRPADPADESLDTTLTEDSSDELVGLSPTRPRRAFDSMEDTLVPFELQQHADLEDLRPTSPHERLGEDSEVITASRAALPHGTIPTAPTASRSRLSSTDLPTRSLKRLDESDVDTQALPAADSSLVPTQSFVVDQPLSSVEIAEELTGDDEFIEMLTHSDEADRSRVPAPIYDSLTSMDDSFDEDPLYDDSFDDIPTGGPTAHYQPVPENETVELVAETSIRGRGHPEPDFGGHRSQRGPSLDDLFPDDEDGVSKLANISEVLTSAGDRPGLPVGPARLDGVPAASIPHPPSAPVSPRPLASPIPRPVGDPPSGGAFVGGVPGTATEDMRLIRAGLGLDPEGRPQLQGVPAMLAQGGPAIDTTEPVRHPRPAPPPMAVSTEKARRGRRLPHDQTSTVPRRRSRWVYLLYAVAALVVVAGGVVGGFKIREIRLDRQILAAERSAAQDTATDTYAGYLRARAGYERIVAARSDPRTRAQLARIRAAIAAEFGDGYDDAETAVERLAGVDIAPAAAARVYLALAADDRIRLPNLVEELTRRHGDDPDARYLAGRTALAAGRSDDAIAAFTEAVKRTNRPRAYVGLGRAQLARGAYSEAKAAFQRALDMVPGHPEAALGVARIAVASGQGIGGAATDLQEILARSNDDPRAPSPYQRAWIGLTLVAIALAGSDADAVGTEIARVRAIRPERDLRFTRAFIRILIDAGENEAAREEAQRAAAAWPERTDVRVDLARIALLFGNAGEVLDILQGDISGDADALGLRGRAYLQRGDTAAARSDLDAALAIAPGDSRALAARARVDVAAGETRAALERLEPALGDPSDEVELSYAAALRADGQLDEARKRVQSVLSRRPGGQAYLELARLERAAGNYADADKNYEQALASLPGEVVGAYEWAILDRDSGRLTEALGKLETLAKSYPESGDILIETARAQILTGAHDEAEATLSAAEKLDSVQEWRVQRERGRLALARREISRAVEFLRAAREARASDPDARLLLVYALFGADREKELNAEVDAILKDFPQGDPVRDLARGQREIFQDRLDSAMKGYRSVRKKLEERNGSLREQGEAVYWIGRVHLFGGDFANASKQLQQATRLDPTNSAAHYYLGLSYSYRKDYRRAAEAFEKAVEIDPAGIPDAWIDLATARLESRQTKGARQAFEEYLARWPEGDQAADARERLDQLR